MKRRFSIDEVINMTDNVYYVTVDDVVDLCDLRDVGFENIRWVKDLFTEFGGCWIAEKCENEVDESLCDSLCTKCKDGDKHGGMLVCLSVRVGRMLDEYCKNNVEVRDRDKVEELMYELNAALDSWNGKGRVNRIILLLENLVDVFREIKKKEKIEKTGLL